MEQGYRQGYATASSEPAIVERWEQLKPKILNLYIEQDMHLSTLVNIMKTDYGFYAV